MQPQQDPRAWTDEGRTFRLGEDNVAIQTSPASHLASFSKATSRPALHEVTGALTLTTRAQPALATRRAHGLRDELVVTLTLAVNFGHFRIPKMVVTMEFSSPSDVVAWLEHEQTIGACERALFHGQLMRDRSLLRTLLALADDVRGVEMPANIVIVPSSVLKAGKIILCPDPMGV